MILTTNFKYQLFNPLIKTLYHTIVIFVFFLSGEYLIRLPRARELIVQILAANRWQTMCVKPLWTLSPIVKHSRADGAFHHDSEGDGESGGQSNLPERKVN